MGVCTYKGGTLPAGSRGMFTDYGGTWTEGEVGAKKEGFWKGDNSLTDNWLIGKDFSSAVGETWNNFRGGDDTAKEDLKDYFTRRYEDDPVDLGIDVAGWAAGGAIGKIGLKGLNMLGLSKLLKGTFWKKGTTTTKFKKPEIDPVTKKIKKGTKFGEVTTTGIGRPKIWPSAIMGTAAYQADKAGVLPFGIGPFSQEGKDAQYQRRLETLKDTVAGLDKKESDAANKAAIEKEASEKVLAEQNRLDNMSFYDKWKLGMKDPRTAALFGTYLSDIGSNIPGQNKGIAAQIDLAAADAAMASANKPNAALHNVTKISNKELMTRFTDDPTFIIGSDTKEARKATHMLGLYRSLEAQLLKSGLPADDVTIMRLLEEDSKRA